VVEEEVSEVAEPQEAGSKRHASRDLKKFLYTRHK
jgi:hypothetical protein